MEQEVRALVDAHKEIAEEPIDAAIWLRSNEPNIGVWLLEVLPGFADDERAEDPTVFTPGRGFRYELHLFPGNEASLLAAIRRDEDFARLVANGTVLHGETASKRLIDAAQTRLQQQGAARA
jgi:hypothetical protein